MKDTEKKERVPPGLIIGFGVVFIALVTAGIWFYRSQHGRLRSEAITTLQSIAELKALQIAEWRSDSLTDAVDDAWNPQTLRLLREWSVSRRPGAEKELLALFSYMKKSYRYREVRFIDPEGRPLLSTADIPERTDLDLTEALLTAIRERRPVLTKFHIGAGDSGPHIGSVAPVFSADTPEAPAFGAVIATIDPGDYLYPLIESWPTPSPSAETLLVTRDGDDTLFLNELRHRKGTALRLRIPLLQSEVPASMAARGKEGPVEGLDYRRIPVLAVLKKIPDSDWSMVSKVDRAEAFAGWRFRAALIIALILALIAAAAAAFLMLWQGRVKAHYRALHEAESARDLSEARYRTTLISIGDGVIVTDTEGNVAFINPTAERLTGWDRHEARGLPLDRIFVIVNEESRRPVENPVRRVLREGLVVGLANHTLLLSRDGREIPIADSGAPIRHKDGPISGVVLVFSDQTAERRVELEMHRSESRFRTVFETANVGKSLTLFSGEVVPNAALSQMLGYTEDELRRKKWQDLTPAEDVESLERLIRPLMEGKKESARFEKRYVRKDGTTFWADVSVTVMRDDEHKPVHFITTVIDISKRREAEKRLGALSARQLAMLAAIPDIIMEVDRNKIYTWANKAGLEFFGPDVVGHAADDFFIGEQETYETVKPLFNGHEQIIYVESWQRRQDGQRRLLGWWCRVLKDAEGHVLGAISSARDITEQKAAEDKIRQSLKEREVMLREIHHRVKNNIQIIASLLRLQSRRLDDEKARAALADSQNRIRSMALIHEKLYQTGDFARIDMGDYFDSMASHLQTVFRDQADRLRLRVEADQIKLDINRAIPVGLIVNELITNAMKHAFPDGRAGEILIRLLHSGEDHFELTVKDDGIGLPESVRRDGGDTFGLEIVRELAHQIDGSQEIRNDGGTEVVIRF